MPGSGGKGAKLAAEVDVAPRRVKAADKALMHLHRLIDLRRVPPGENLPPAAAVGVEAGVNRMAVLQAFQMLQKEGLIEVKPGRGGARVIARDDRTQAQRLARAVGIRDALVKMDLFREIMESGIARTVAERGLDAGELGRARDLVRQMRRTEDRDAYIALDVAFHELLADATASPVLATLATAVRVMFLVALDAVELPADRLRSSNEEHAKILAAVARGAPAAAAEHAYRHASSSMHLIMSELGWNGESERSGR